VCVCVCACVFACGDELVRVFMCVRDNGNLVKTLVEGWSHRGLRVGGPNTCVCVCVCTKTCFVGSSAVSYWISKSHRSLTPYTAKV